MKGLMPETSGIHEIINPGGTGSSFSPAYSKIVSKTRAKKSGLKIGEIIPGRVIEVQPPDIAVVNLPEGIFTAVLHSNLKKDDYLYFKVTETEPGLVLKIFSVPSKYEGKHITVENIIRILFLPENIFFTQLVSFLKIVRKNIIRDEIIKINQFFSNLPANDKNYSSLQNSFSLIIFIIDNNLPLTLHNYHFFSPIFFVDKLSKNLEKLDSLIHKSNDKIFDDLKDKFAQIKTARNINLLFEFFLYPNEIDNKAFIYSTLTILLQKLENNEEFKEISDPIKYLISSIDAIHLFNLIKLKNKKPITLIIPYYHDGKFKLVTVKAQKKLKTDKEKVEISFQTEHFDELSFNIEKFDDIFEVQIKNKSKKFEKLIKELINKLSDSLDKKNLKLGLVRMVEEFEDSNKTTENQNEQNNQAISVVI